MLVKLLAHGPAGSIILNRPEKRNALSRELLNELEDAFRTFHREKPVRAVVLTGAGAAFCAGMDLGEMQAAAGDPRAHELWQEDAERYQELLQMMLRFPKPIIAAVN